MTQDSINPDLEPTSSGGRPITWLAFTLFSVVLFGLLYTAITTLIGQTLFPAQARGSLLERDGTVIGSSLIGQTFTGERYFIGRPSSAGRGFDPTSASGSNLASSNPALRTRAEATAQEIAARENVALEQIPVDLIAASGSGLDPHISAAAELQVPRVARARGISEDEVRQAVQRSAEAPSLGFLGQPRVNVVLLNLSLDR